VSNEQVGLPKHAFVVAKPGEHKELEWGNAETLKELMNGAYYERIAQHVSSNDVLKSLLELGYSIELLQTTVWQSRVPNKPLPGYILVAKKGEHYKYHPWKFGHTPDTYGDTERWAESRERRVSLTYIQDMASRLQQHIPFPLSDVYPYLIELARQEAISQRLIEGVLNEKTIE
jgi:hypothetical protein